MNICTLLKQYYLLFQVIDFSFGCICKLLSYSFQNKVLLLLQLDLHTKNINFIVLIKLKLIAYASAKNVLKLLFEFSFFLNNAYRRK